MGRVLRSDVHTREGRFRAGTAESDIPGHVRIPNPAAWCDSDGPPVGPTPQDDGAGSTDAERSGGEVGDTPAIPNRAGPGSAAKAWIAYAEHHGVVVDPEANREEVIAQLMAVGVLDE
jgi:hypothetical protein